MLPTPSLVVTNADANQSSLRRARELAARLGFPFVAADAEVPSGVQFLLAVGDRGLALHPSDDMRSSLRVDFVRGSTAYRRESAHQRNQLLARAVGLRGTGPRVFDATAGLGRDAFLLACLGCEVTAVERSPVVAALLRDGIERAAEAGKPELSVIANRIDLIEGDARDVLQGWTRDARPEVVYVDPMYPECEKAALAKKEMRICRHLIGDDEDAADLFAVARSVAARRVVVKRHRHAPPLVADPSVTYRGRTVRYDAYDRMAGLAKPPAL